MVHTGIFATSDEILTKAGANYSTLVTEARINALCLQVESFINLKTRRNWSTLYAGLNSATKGILALLESNLVARYVINHQMSGYTAQREAEVMLDILTKDADEALGMIKDQKEADFMENP